MTEQAVHPCLPDILSVISSPKKRENFELEIDSDRITTDGSLAAFYSGRCLNKDTGEITYIVIKVIPVSGVKSYEDVYRNDVCFYTKIFPQLDKFQKEKGVKERFKNIPRFLGGHLTEKREFLIMENLKTGGYEFFDRTQNLKGEDLEKIFQVYGKFHGLSFAYKHAHPKEFEAMIKELVDISKSVEKKRFANYMEVAYYAIVNTFDLELECDVINRLKSVTNIQEILTNARNCHGNHVCVTHGDCWLNNMLLKYKESGELEDIKLIDFQLVYASTPVHDLSSFFYPAAAKADMDKLDYYLEIYHKSFSSIVIELGGNPQELYPFELFKEEWKKYSLAGIIVGIGMWTENLIDKNEVNLLMKKEGLQQEYCFEIWNANVSQIRKKYISRERARDICLHAVEYGIL